MKISIVLGTRPEIIKMAPIIRECVEKKLDFYILHTGQHYSHEMDKIFFEELELPQPKYNLEVGSANHGEQTGSMLAKIENTYLKDRPDVTLVQGDTNTVLAGALAASKLGIKIGHVEAGLRSFDRTMPEEINRILVDHISDYLFVPINTAKNLALQEGIPENKIFLTGNTIVDSVIQNQKIADNKSNILEKLQLQKHKYILATCHRPENVDKKEKLLEILNGLKKITEEFNLDVIFPIHPRTKKMIDHFGIKIENNIKTINPLGFLDFLKLEANSKLIITDSGGVQEEACILKIPCITLRENTERPETIDVGASILSGSDAAKILHSAKKMMNKSPNWHNPYGDGNAGKKIISILNSQSL